MLGLLAQRSFGVRMLRFWLVVCPWLMELPQERFLC